MTSHIALDIHPVNMFLAVLISLLVLFSFLFLILDGSKEEMSSYNDEYTEEEETNDEPDPKTVEEIYETAEQIREEEQEEDCFGAEATESLKAFNQEEPHEKQIEEHLPDILLLVRMPYDRGCDLLRRYDNDDIQFYGWHTEGRTRKRSQSI